MKKLAKRSQMELIKGELPAQANEVAVSEYFLSAYGSNARIGETVRLDTESFHGDYTVPMCISKMTGSLARKPWLTAAGRLPHSLALRM